MSPLRTLIACLLLGSAEGEVRAARGEAASGHVVYETQDALFLDKGAQDGLRPRDTLLLQQGGWSIGKCIVVQVYAHKARCTAISRALGARFVVPREAPEEAEPAAHVLPPLFSTRTQRRAQQAIKDSAPVRIDYRARGTRKLARRVLAAWASLAHDGWMEFGGGNRNLQRERVDVALLGAQLLPNRPWQASLRASAIGWSARSPGVRFRPHAPAQLYVWQAQVDNRRQRDGLQWAAGRIAPVYVPGMPMLDGAQVGYRFLERDVEVGGFLGLVPSVVTSLPQAHRFAVGAYNYLQAQLGKGAFVQHLARLAFVAIHERQSRFELETVTGLRVGQALVVGLNPRFGALLHGGLRLEAARADVALHWRNRLHLLAVGRYATGDIDVVSGISDVATAVRTSAASQETLTFTPCAWLSLSAINAVAWDEKTRYLHVLTGPELGFPRLFGARGGLSLAYLQETGTLPARSAFAQSQYRMSARTQGFVRTSYFEDTFQTDNVLREMSIYLGIRAQLHRALALDVSALGRHGFHNHRFASDAPYSLRTSIRLIGRL